MEFTYQWGIQFSDQFFPEYTHDFVVENHRSKYASVPVDFKWEDLPLATRTMLKQRLRYRFIEDRRQQIWNRIRQAERSRVVPIRRIGQFHRYLQDHYKRTSPTQAFQMTSFAGGTYSFPITAWPEIRRLRNADIDKGIALFDNEAALSETGVRFFVEVDYRVDLAKLYWDEAIPNFTDLCNDAVALFTNLQRKFEGKLSGAVLLTSPPKLKNDRIIGVGSHLIFSNLTVNCELGRKLCLYLREGTGLDIDDTPYKTQYACLRPAFSRKVGDCPDCVLLGEYRKNDCNYCLGNLKVGLGSFYTPVLVLNKLGECRPYTNEPTYITPDEGYHLSASQQFRIY